MQKYDFELIQEENIAEIFGTARLWRHKITGAELLSVTNNDENKCFGVSLRTPPKDDTGIAHILEHSVLCGSEKYPVKELFAELIKGSLQTFLNAFTFPDKTCYPVASVNLQDFYNLIDVYLDAVFHPRINEDTLRQEGFRVEAQNGNKEEWSFQGVVYNEMKGVYSSPDSVLMEASQQALFPNHLYGLDSGGNPKHIPDLTYAQFKDFHNKYYHPTNARFFFWGDDDEDQRLKFLSDFLVGYEKIELDSQIPLMPKLTNPRYIEIAYPSESIEQKSAHATVSWLLCETAQSKEIFELEILCRILLGLPGSPLRRALLESGLGEDLAGAGLETDLRQAYFSIGLRSMQADKVNDLELLIFDTLAELAISGLDKDDIEAAVNSIEFALRENNSGSFPRGLSAMLRSLSTWLYDGEALSNLAWEKDFAEIKAKIASGEKVFEKLIQKYFLDNEHRAVVTLLPDANLAAQKTAEELSRLEKITKNLNESESAKLVEQSQKLLAMQNAADSPEALASIPSLKVEDLAKKNTALPIEVSQEAKQTYISHDLDCMGIVYTNLLFEMHSLPDELLALVPLYARTLTEMGTQKHSFVELGQMIAAKTGGIGAAPSLHKHLIDPKPIAKLCFVGKATADKVDAMLDIFAEILNEIDFDDQERFLLMVLEEKARLEQSLVPSGHSYVSLRLEAAYSLVDNIEERQDGVSYLFYLRELANRVQNDWTSVCKDLQKIHELIINQDKLVVDLACDAKYRQNCQTKIRQFVDKLPLKKYDIEKWSSQKIAKQEALITPAEVNYVGLAMNIYDQGYKFKGSALVIFRHLRMSYLWEKVRVQGGAYGVFIRFSRVSGVTKLVSYRDPNLAKTLEVYNNLAKYLENIQMSERDLARAIVGAISDFDAYMLPQAKASAALWRYLSGENDENRQLIRDELLSTKVSDFKDLAPYISKALNDTRLCALGSKALQSYAQENNWQSLLLNS